MCMPSGKGEEEDGGTLRTEKGSEVLKTTSWLTSSASHTISCGSTTKANIQKGT